MGYDVYVFQSKNTKYAWFLALTDALRYAEELAYEYDSNLTHTVITVVDHESNTIKYVERNYSVADGE